MFTPLRLRAAATPVWSALLAFGLASCDGTDDAGEVELGLEPGSVEWKVQNAMSAAPEPLAADATIMDWAEGSAPVVLRAGTNGWTCFPSAPDVPFNDPKCVDEVAELWLRSLGSRTTPTINTVGLSYMLAGGAVASASDPFAELPPEGDEWLIRTPHVLLYFPAGVLDTSDLPTDLTQPGPWLMHSGTPYVHIMVPTAPVSADPLGDLDEESVEWMSQNALSAGPEATVQGATILGWAPGRSAEMTVLRTGTSEWRCATNTRVKPVDDPICVNRQFTLWEQAYGARVTPRLTSPGIGYMLQGGAIADFEDIFAEVPPAGQEWHEGGPHFMVALPPGSVDLSGFPGRPPGYPWIHFAGTQWAHLMIPVQ